MLIAQITDLHLGFDRADPAELNARRLAAVIDRVLDHRPDLVIASGDLTEHGDAASYACVRRALARLPMPVLAMVGNHDRRGPFADAFPDTPIADGFVQYVVDAGPLRVIALDTLEEGRHAGAFCARRAAWLDARLAEAPERPTLIALHHPPVAIGIGWMDLRPDAAWPARLAATIARHRQVGVLIAGHYHRAAALCWAGTALAICSSTAPQLVLDLAPIAADRPDGRGLIVAEAPAFALHRWTGDRFLSHFATAGDDPILARFDAALQPMVAALMDEPPTD